MTKVTLIILIFLSIKFLYLCETNIFMHFNKADLYGHLILF
jgi:hypothetical protein